MIWSARRAQILAEYEAFNAEVEAAVAWVNSYEAMLITLAHISDQLHRAANGAGTVNKMTIGQIKKLCRILRDDANETLAQAKAKP